SAVEGNRPLGEAVDSLAESYPARWVRGKIRKAAERMSLGTDWVESLWSVGLIRSSAAGVLQSGQRAGNLAWSLRILADREDRILGYRLQILTQLVLPLVVVSIGILVFFCVAAYFLPLVRLIEELA